MYGTKGISFKSYGTAETGGSVAYIVMIIFIN